MPLQIIVGAQWGDEGKGRIVDWFAADADIVARYNGGDNAGHSVTVGEQLFKLHLIPSGIIHPKPVAVLGNGMVINPESLLHEMDMLAELGVEISPRRLRVSHAAHLITPAHRALDAALEARRGKDSIGTTGRGIGPAYTDKAARTNLRVGEMLSPDFRDKLAAHIETANRTLVSLEAPHLELSPVLAKFSAYASRIAPFIADTSAETCAVLARGGSVLAEGAQGTLLDLDHGTYPFVTSSATTAGGVFTGLGIGITAARDATVTGVCKSFQTRVGSGPFPTEVFDDLALRLRGTGANPWDEYGTTTGRPRRVGWLDGVLLRYAVRVNGLTELVITKLDILSGLEQVKLCVAYRKNGTVYQDLPFGPTELEGFEPVYKEFPGWKEDVSGLRRWNDLPQAARTYLDAIGQLAGVPVRLVSVGPEREQIVER
ncbi:MAG: adenylosuccinate synthase [Anaerolineales bacterium]|nr:adenylosuccinate synthase [Anaerolineales bacterium]MCX7756631.1 adenylosuccinate synthase [Anaerolineales bacterium]MDW8277294.1 adenylosuccinate synthase [Anaerolineales bacterium]